MKSSLHLYVSWSGWPQIEGFVRFFVLLVSLAACIIPTYFVALFCHAYLSKNK